MKLDNSKTELIPMIDVCVQVVVQLHVCVLIFVSIV